MARVFVDTNVLVYVHDDADPRKHKAAREVRDVLVRRSQDVAVSAQVLNELYVTLRRHRFDPPTAQRIVTSYGYFGTVVPIDLSLVEAALECVERHQLSLWDALIIQAARRAGAAVVLTEDLNTGQTVDGVRIVNPFADGFDPAGLP